MVSNYSYNLSPGKMLGRQYRVLEFLGQGWEGEVYKIEERTTGIIRAAKLFYPKRYHEFPHVTYAQKLYRLRTCPIVIRYHHQDTTRIKGENVNFLVSNFIDGEVLSQYIANQPKHRLMTFEALHLFYAIVQGVEHIHFLGEYHGDIHEDNIIVKRRGLTFDVHLIDLMHLGKPTKARIQQDVIDIIAALYQMIGGAKYYKRVHNNFRKIILGKKQSLISKQFKTAGHIRLFLENLEWE